MASWVWDAKTKSYVIKGQGLPSSPLPITSKQKAELLSGLKVSQTVNTNAPIITDPTFSGKTNLQNATEAIGAAANKAGELAVGAAKAVGDGAKSVWDAFGSFSDFAGKVLPITGVCLVVLLLFSRRR